MIAIAILIIKQIKRTKTKGNYIVVKIFTYFTFFFIDDFFPCNVHRFFQFCSIKRRSGVNDLKTFSITQFFIVSIGVKVFKNRKNS